MQYPATRRGLVFSVNLDESGVNFSVTKATYGDRIEVGIFTAFRPLYDTVNVQEVVIVTRTEFANTV